MASTDVKIYSNPYIKQTSFYTRVPGGEWLKYDESESDSKLLSEKYQHGFHSLHAQELLGVISDEFGDRYAASPVTVFFEGSDDEFLELEVAASSDEMRAKIDLRQDSRHLANAREILPLIKAEFDAVRPLIEDVARHSEDVRLSLDQFDDATSPSVPVCVVGNYSAGKSTFINALIGHELLPNGEDPVTAKLYKITQAPAGEGVIRFELGDTRHELLFSESSDAVEGVERVPAEIREAALRGSSMIPRMADTLDAVNSYEPGEDGPALQDLIEVEVPFRGIEARSGALDLVVFDTPGNGSRSNADHIEVLNKAMSRMSNGLTVFVGTRDSLDSADGADLCDRVKGIEALDGRFAMIVVNKADEAGLPKDQLSDADVDRIRGQAIPRIMSGQGMYFVSSILALGAKTSGGFSSDVYAEKYDEKSAKYTDRANRYYKELYRYNIMPEQRKRRAIEAAEACPDLLFANSGLACVEQAIEEFATRHSAYNKCQQAKQLFEKAVSGTRGALEAERERASSMRDERARQLDDASRRLIERVEDAAADFKDFAVGAYPSQMETLSEGLVTPIGKDELSDREARLTAEEREKNGYVEQDARADQSLRAIGENFIGDIAGVFTEADPTKIADAFGGLGEDAKAHLADLEKRRSLSSQADRCVAEALLGEVRKRLAGDGDRACREIELGSKTYWGDAASDYKDKLCEVVADASALPRDKREVIMNTIISYEDLELSMPREEPFDKDDLLESFGIGNVKFWVGDKLDKPKLAGLYNNKLVNGVADWSSEVGRSHRASFTAWLESLTSLVTDNIAEFNADLADLNGQIRRLEAAIDDREAKLRSLKDAQAEVYDLMDLHERM